MKSGELTAQGTLFMRASIYEQRTSSGELQLVFPLLERRGSGVQHVTAIWKGVDAQTFYRAHGSTIKAGKALSFTFSRLFCHNNELHAIVYTCSLAPDRWETAHGDASHASTTSTTQPNHHQPETANQ